MEQIGQASQDRSRRAAFLTHPIFSAPAFGRNHPLSIPRHGAVVALARAMDWLDDADTVECPLPTRDVLARFHDPAYLAALANAAATMTAVSAGAKIPR